MFVKSLFLLSLFSFCAFAMNFDYNGKYMDINGKTVTPFAAYKGKPLIVIYYSLECSKCKKAFQDLTDMRNKGKGPEIVGIVTSSETEKIFRKNKNRSIPSYFDKWKAFKTAFKVEFVPAVVAVKPSGEVCYKREEYHPENFRQVIDNLSLFLTSKSAPKPKMENRYYGEQVCSACHGKIGDWWIETGHAEVYKKVAERKFKKSGFRTEFAKKIPPEELDKITTGFGRPTGYDPELHQKHLLGVQCEACHGPAGPHDGVPERDIQASCLRCHTSADDPTFEVKSAIRKMNHPKNK